MGTTDPISEILIANLAGDIIGEDEISSLEDPGRIARFMVRNFGPARDEILAMFPWKHAKEYAILPADATAPKFGWAYSYTLPTDQVWVLPPKEKGVWAAPTIPHEVVGDKIYTDCSAPLNVIYIKRVTDPSKFPPLFVRVLAAYLARLASLSVTGKEGYQDRAEKALMQAMDSARLQETLTSGTPEPQQDDDIVRIRGVGLDSHEWSPTY